MLEVNTQSTKLGGGFLKSYSKPHLLRIRETSLRKQVSGQLRTLNSNLTESAVTIANSPYINRYTCHIHNKSQPFKLEHYNCLLYTSDAADE